MCLCTISLFKQPSTQSASLVIARQRYDHTRGGVTHPGEEWGRKVCLRSSSLVLAVGQLCHCDSQVSQSRLEKQAQKQITGVKERHTEREGREGEIVGGGLREEASSQDESRLLGSSYCPLHSEWRLGGIAELVRWEFPQACRMS